MISVGRDPAPIIHESERQKVQGREKKARRTRGETLDSSDERTSAFMCSERRIKRSRLDEKVPSERAVRNNRARPETNDAKRPNGPTNDELPTKFARVRRADVEAEMEDKVADETKTDKPAKLADQRNLVRVDKADEIDRSLLSECHLPDSIDEFLPSAIPGPDNCFEPPAWLMQATEEIALSEVQTPLAPPIRFDLSDNSVKFNPELLTKSDLDLEKFLASHQRTTLNFGSEFCPINHLRKILGGHPNFGFFSDVLTNGVDYHVTEELTEEQRKAEVAAMMERGNHQSVQQDNKAVAELLAKDVQQGFSLPVSPELMPNLAHALVQPAGVVNQFSLQADGSRAQKKRLTQDLHLFP